MRNAASPLSEESAALANDSTDPTRVMEECLRKANGNALRNTYITLDAERARREAAEMASAYRGVQKRPPLYGIPISVKDCFDIAGTRTSCGSRFYATHNPLVAADSALVSQLRNAGALLPGKTHLHQLAWGITGENRDYGDCAQPANAALLTGGSSSGAAASVLEGSAIAAIGTDTGGSVRVPAALCGLAGFRTSYGVGSWQGAYHLAPSFDTLGVLFRDLRDGPLLAEAIFSIACVPPRADAARIGFVSLDFMRDCTPEVLDAFARWKEALSEEGAKLTEFDTSNWADAMEIFAGIQAPEASTIHRGNFAQFEEEIGARLAWGESLSSDTVAALHQRCGIFRDGVRALFDSYDFLMIPCAPMHQLAVGVDHSATRKTILRYTIPISLAGLPVVTLPAPLVGGCYGAGVQLVGAYGEDARLLSYAASLGGRFSPQC